MRLKIIRGAWAVLDSFWVVIPPLWWASFKGAPKPTQLTLLSLPPVPAISGPNPDASRRSDIVLAPLTLYYKCLALPTPSSLVILT